MDKVDLFRLPVCLKQGKRVLHGQFGLGKRHVRIDDFLHPVGYAGDLFIRNRADFRTSVMLYLLFADFAIESAWERIVDHQNVFRIQFAHCLLQDETKRADVGSSALCVVVSYEIDNVRCNDAMP